MDVIKPEVEKAFEPHVQFSQLPFYDFYFFQASGNFGRFAPTRVISPVDKQHSTTRLIRDAFS